MESKHTPGPWTTTSIHPQRDWVNASGRAALAEVAVVVSGREWPEGKANARLIAAAPDLLAACTRALGFVDSMPDNDNVGLADCLRAVIAKAEGREP